MIIHLATDHAGFYHKEAVASWLKEAGFDVQDHGAVEYDELDDFTDFISKAAEAVNDDPNSKAVIFGGSGQGEAMLANSYPMVRAVVYYGGDEIIPVLSRQHNDSNILSIGARFVDVDLTKKLIWDWLHAEALSDEKYQRRNKKIAEITKSLHS
ncbi:RpiB/LacA/LacB family sugar-phosphate isomerase [Candidatus Nomurabacteria bacterium]|nr:RpiB/LacA/LacB family sugar-phosphate isomerase [Candidatus Nomurabacteria bacterium]